VENELLPRWARAHAQHNEHDERLVLEAVEIMGAALAARFADPTLAEIARTISAAVAVRNEERLAALTRGYLAYAAARSVVDTDTDEARSLFRSAWTSLREAGSPSAYSAGMYAAAKAYEGRDYADALRLIAAMKSGGALTRYAPLAGQVDWVEGMVLLASGRPYESLRRYREALSAFQRSGEAESAAAVDGLLAENLQSLGDDDEAWRYRLKALPVILDYGDSRRQQVAFNEAAEAAMQQNRLSAALEYQMASVALTSPGSNDHMAAYSYLGRALIFGRKGQADLGLADIERARHCSAHMSDAVIRKTTTADIDMAEALLRQRASPAAAVQLLTRVLDEQRGGGYQFRKAQLLLARGRAKVRLGNDVGARTDFSRAIEAIETQREDVSDLRLRSAFFGRADDAYEELTALLVRSGETSEALRVFDRSCERTLTEVVRSNHAVESLPRNGGVHPIPGDGSTLVEITVLPDEVVAWTMRRSGISISRHSVSSARVEELVERYERAIDADSQEVQTIGSDLFDIVIRPLGLRPESDKTVTFITHRLLRRVPLASLYDRARKQYLVKDFAVGTAPSAAVYWFCSARRSDDGQTGEVVAIGNTRTAALALDLPDLPEAERELTHFASRMRGRLLLNERATPTAFLTAAAGKRIIYFAGHALVDEHDRGRSALVLAPEGAEPSSALLHADQIANARLRAPLVVLSACTTNSVTRRAAEGAVDVAGAFLAAGVPTVVTSRWAVADDRARDLLTIFARELAASSPAEALRRSQLEMLRRGNAAQRAVRSWCAFEVVGSV
jgi:CHAT domain-containing protein